MVPAVDNDQTFRQVTHMADDDSKAAIARLAAVSATSPLTVKEVKSY